VVEDLNVVGGHVALDLVNTVDPRVPGGTGGNEHLRCPDDLLEWAQRVALLDADEARRVRAAWAGGRGADALDATRELREATYAALLAVLGQVDDATAALELVARRWAEAAARSALSLTPVGRTHDRLQIGNDPALMVPDRLAHAAVDLLRTVDLARLKVCPLDEGGCGWLFLDHSRNGSRRWCSMDDCGARAKARRLTARRRTARAG
jgi:predicted RNA-binding Zn ribbon-like protein